MRSKETVGQPEFNHAFLLVPMPITGEPDCMGSKELSLMMILRKFLLFPVRSVESVGQISTLFSIMLFRCTKAERIIKKTYRFFAVCAIWKKGLIE